MRPLFRCRRAALLVAAALLAACALRGPQPPSGPVSEEAARLAAPNRLDKALAAAPRGWRFSGLLSRGDEAKHRLPLLLLVRAAPAVPEQEAGLEALLLTETGVRLCLVRVDRVALAVSHALPGNAASLCRAAAPALRALFLSPQPDPRDRPLPGRDGPQLLREDLRFSFSPAGALTETRWSGPAGWSASYGGHSRENGFWLPKTLRYKDNAMELRLLRLMPGDS